MRGISLIRGYGNISPRPESDVKQIHATEKADQFNDTLLLRDS